MSRAPPSTCRLDPAQTTPCTVFLGMPRRSLKDASSQAYVRNLSGETPKLSGMRCVKQNSDKCGVLLPRFLEPLHFCARSTGTSWTPPQPGQGARIHPRLTWQLAGQLSFPSLVTRKQAKRLGGIEDVPTFQSGTQTTRTFGAHLARLGETNSQPKC